MSSKQVQVHHINNLNYQEVWDFQTNLHQKLIHNKIVKRREPDKTYILDPIGHFILCEHRPVYTLGKSGKLDHLLLSPEILKQKDIEYFPINRGGDITYHGPGQITGYLILDLDYFGNDAHVHVRNIEQSIINCLDTFGLNGKRIPDFTGVWLEDESQRKLCAIGVHLSRWVSMHGFGLNVNTNLQYFNNIIPCGISKDEKQVSSMSNELGKPIDMDKVKLELLTQFSNIFGLEYINV